MPGQTVALDIVDPYGSVIARIDEASWQPAYEADLDMCPLVGTEGFGMDANGVAYYDTMQPSPGESMVFGADVDGNWVLATPTAAPFSLDLTPAPVPG